MFQVVLFLVFLCSVALGAEEFDVRMSRPSKVGDRLSVTGTFEDSGSQLVKVDGKVAKNDEALLKVEFQYELEVIGVTRAGKVSGARAKLVKFDCKRNGTPVAELRAGDVIESSSDGETPTVTVNGQPPTPLQKKIADAIITTNKEGATTDDDVFGPGRKVKVGDEWQINRDASAKLGAQEGVPGIKPETVKGSVKVVEVTQIGGKPHLRLRGTFEVSDPDLAPGNIPPGIKVDRTVFSARMEGDCPVDLKSVTPKSAINMAMQVDSSGEMERNGRKFKMEMTVKFATHLELQMKALP